MARVVVRPSGTEPKLKSYLEVVVPVHDADDDAESVTNARATARAQLDAIMDDLSKALALS